MQLRTGLEEVIQRSESPESCVAALASSTAMANHEKTAPKDWVLRSVEDETPNCEPSVSLTALYACRQTTWRQTACSCAPGWRRSFRRMSLWRAVWTPWKPPQPWPTTRGLLWRAGCAAAWRSRLQPPPAWLPCRSAQATLYMNSSKGMTASVHVCQQYTDC